MRVLVSNADFDSGPASYVPEEESYEKVAGSGYHDYSEYLVFEVSSLEEVIEKIDYSGFIVNLDPADFEFTEVDESEIDYTIKIYDYYVE